MSYSIHCRSFAPVVCKTKTREKRMALVHNHPHCCGRVMLRNSHGNFITPVSLSPYPTPLPPTPPLYPGRHDMSARVPVYSSLDRLMNGTIVCASNGSARNTTNALSLSLSVFVYLFIDVRFSLLLLYIPRAWHMYGLCPVGSSSIRSLIRCFLPVYGYSPRSS